MNQERPSLTRILNSVGLVATSLAASIFALEVVFGLLRASEVPALAQRAVLLLTGIYLALTQWKITGALGRRVRARPVEHPVVTGSSYAASGILLALVALIVR